LIILAILILILYAGVGVWQGKSASDSLEALSQLQPMLCTVLRQGAFVADYPAQDLVPGDVVELRVGDRIPADARLLNLKSSSLQVDEASLTGESVTVSKLPGDKGTVQVLNRSEYMMMRRATSDSTDDQQ
jgi:Ca2+-transporting ATPase